MGADDLAVIALLVLAFVSVSGRVEGTVLTPPLLFVGAGLVLGPSGAGLLTLELSDAAVRTLAEATLVLVLFTDAARIDLAALRREFGLPTRLLGIGSPLTVAAGALAALVLFDLNVWEALLLGAVLAPTDAALAQPVITDPRVPVRVRQTLNVESGLNDGLLLPVVTAFVALSGASEGTGSAGFWLGFAVRQIGFGVLVGLGVGWLGGVLLDRAARRDWLGGPSRRLGALALAGASFAIASWIGGNGFIACFLAGLAFGTAARGTCMDALTSFTEAEGELLSLLVFLIFGGAVAGPALGASSWQVVVYALASLTVVRMVPTVVALIGSGLHAATVGFLGWFGPRGLASILFALFVVEDAGVRVADEILLVAAWTVLASVLAHGLSGAPGARWYARHIGSHRELGKAVEEHGPASEHPSRTSRSAPRAER